MYVSTTDYTVANAPETFTRSLIDTGFGVLSNHPLRMEQVNTVFDAWQHFFNTDEKFNYLFNKEAHDGYFPFEVAETAKGHEVKDIKEFFHVYPWGRIPEQLKKDTLTLYDSLSQLAQILLQWIENYTPAHIRNAFAMPLSQMIIDSPRTMLRILHYPPLQGNEAPGSVRAAEHEDIDLLTLLPAATAPGLEVKDAKGNWHAITCDPGTIIVNAGDMLQMCSQGYYPSTTHRVVNPKNQIGNISRMSMPLFLHPRPEVRLSDKHTANSYREERLKELGLL